MLLLWTGRISKQARSGLHEMGLDLAHYEAAELVRENDFIAAVQSASLYVCGGLETLSSRVIDAAPRLRLAVFLGTDYSGYFDIQAASARGLAVKNTPGANSRSVAELTLCYILMGLRHVNHANALLKQAAWAPPTTGSLNDMTAFLIGCGNVGSRVARFLAAIGCRRLHYWSRQRKYELEAELGLCFCSVDEGLGLADLTSIHVPGNGSVCLGSARLKSMKPGAILINAARPDIVDAGGLLEALTSGGLAFSAFDGFYGDGKRDLSPIEAELLQLTGDKFFATPHIGWRTFEADQAMFSQALDIIADFIGLPSSSC